MNLRVAVYLLVIMGAALPSMNGRANGVPYDTGEGYYLKEKGGYRIRRVSIFNSSSKSFMHFDLKFLPKETYAFSKIVNLKNEASLLIGIKDDSEMISNVTFMNLQTGQVIKMNVSSMKLRHFYSVRESSDGRMEGIFLSEYGVKIVQLYGPVPEGGP